VLSTRASARRQASKERIIRKERHGACRDRSLFSLRKCRHNVYLVLDHGPSPNTSDSFTHCQENNDNVIRLSHQYQICIILTTEGFGPGCKMRSVLRTMHVAPSSGSGALEVELSASETFS